MILSVSTYILDYDYVLLSLNFIVIVDLVRFLSILVCLIVLRSIIDLLLLLDTELRRCWLSWFSKLDLLLDLNFILPNRTSPLYLFQCLYRDTHEVSL